jgi:hypothetical protein
MNDRDLLELAAKATGIKQTCWIDADHEWFQARGVGYNDADDCQQRWNPLEDDGQALRLAVKLKIELAWYLGSGYTVVHWDMGTKKIAEYGDGTYSVTRRAIVRAAAEIGKKL